ncbi:MAG: hypothetical protein LBE92_08435 [Chryseobacterium sp.]|uniref:hypothetical protein n=1 Tax=Chryseobacterium sp. TaxID=1871047 RepID=UPI002819334E|nr:hypothetical protein [Chryseobacterium sp.]MDR2236137.1 hypothetical protein [Chryseobacterium sp.]
MKITIPKPCHENWDHMITDEKGKLCSVCSKMVYDFTDFSDEELLNRFESTENGCGRFREDQLDRNLSFSVTKKLALGLLTVGGMLTSLPAQEAKSAEIKPSEKIGGVTMAHSLDDSGKPIPLRMGAPLSKQAEKPLILLNNKMISVEELQTLKPETVESVNSLKLAEAMKQYGEKAKNGVILITTKKKRKLRP